MDQQYDDTTVPDIQPIGALDVASHLARALGVSALSGIKGLSVLPHGTDAAANAIREYQDKYGPSPDDLSPAGQDTIRNTVAPLYRGLQDTFHTKELGDAYGQGSQELADLAGKYLGPTAAGVAGTVADTAPYALTPEGLLGKGAATAVAKTVPELARAYDGSSLHSLQNEGYAAKQAQGAAISVNKATDIAHPTAGLIGYHPDALVIDAHDPSTMEHVGRLVAEPSQDGSMLQGRTADVFDEANRGQGVGTKMLRSGVDHAHSNDMDWGSDVKLSPGQVATYMKLQEQGYPMQFNPTASITEDNYMTSGDGKPVLTIPKPTDPDTADLNEPTTFNPNSYIGSQAHAEGGLIGDELGKLVAHIAEKGGITKDLKTGAMPTSGYAVSVQKGLEHKTPGQPTAQDIQSFVQTNQGPLSQPNEHFGAWRNPETGEHFLDVTHVEPDFGTAVKKAQANNQLAIYDLGTGETIPTTPDYMHFEHYSNLNTPTATLDPAFYGTGMKGAEAKRGGTKVTSLYPAGATPEAELANKTKYRVTVPTSSLYDMSNDPLGLRVNAPSYSDAEDAVKDAGYSGYYTPTHANPLFQGQARMFGPTPAVRIGPGAAAPAEEDLSAGFAEGGEVAPVLSDLSALVAKYGKDSPALDNFKTWFGQSVAHTNGVPDTYYTGTSKDKDFPSFNVGRHGVWFDKNPDNASMYATSNDSMGSKYENGRFVSTNTASRVMPVYLKAENPFTGPQTFDMMYGENYRKANSDFFDQLRSQGYDSWMPEDQPGLAVILTDPTQIKSAVGNTGDFDSTVKAINKADGGPIRMEGGGEIAPALDDLGALVAKYAEGAPNTHAAQLASTAADTGSVTYNPTSGELHTGGYLIPSEPSRSVALGGPPDADEVHDFMLQNQDAFSADPKAVLHVESDEHGNGFMHVAHHEPDFQQALMAAKSVDAQAVHELHTGNQFPVSQTEPVGAGAEADQEIENYLTHSKHPGANMPAELDAERNERPQAPWTHGQPTVANPQRTAFPGIYNDPRQVISDANAMVGPQDPLLQRLFGVDRQDLSDIAQSRQGNELGQLPGAKPNPTGAASALGVMTPQNEQRLIDVLNEAKGTPLHTGMTGWYTMDPLYQRFVQIFGEDEAPSRYAQFNTLMGMASPGSDVGTEIARGTSANWLHNQGRFEDFRNFAGVAEGERPGIPDFPQDMLGVPGHAYHPTAQAGPMADYLRTGSIQMKSPKVPMYIGASGVPQIGFQSDLPVGDAHWARGVGLADTRNWRTLKGEQVVPGSSVSTPEMQTLAPWWRDRVAAQAGYQSVPAQATAWGAFAPYTGVGSAIGAPKLEILATQIGKLANRLGVSPETARDLVIQGKAGAY